MGRKSKRRREASEHRYVTEVTEKYASRVAWLPWQPEEPVGPNALAQLASTTLLLVDRVLAKAEPD